MAYRYVPDPHGRPPHVTFETPQDYVQYIADIEAGKFPGLTVDPGSRRQAEEIKKNPGAWIMSGGHPRKQDDWLARNLHWLGPAVVGSAIAGPFIAGAVGGGGGGGAAAAGGGMSGSGASALGGAAINAQVDGLMAGSTLAAGKGASYLGGAAINSQVDKLMGGSAASGFGQQAANWLKNPRNIAGLAGSVPMAMQALGGSGGSGSSPNEDALLDEIRANLGLQRARFNGAQPSFDAAQQLARQMAPRSVQGPFGGQ